jgi:hypothetical protein
MTSYSAEPPRTGAIALGAALLLLGGACTRIKVEDSAAEFTRTSDKPCGDATEMQLSGDPQAATRTMDTYVVQIMELSDVADAGRDPNACAECAATGQGCKVALQQCYCGGPTTASPAQLKLMMSGTRLGALDYGDLYCLRVMAIDRSSLQGDPPRSCDCSDKWIPPDLSPNVARLCAVSAPYSAGPLGFLLDLQCPSDGQSFSACIGAR